MHVLKLTLPTKPVTIADNCFQSNRQFWKKCPKARKFYSPLPKLTLLRVCSNALARGKRHIPLLHRQPRIHRWWWWWWQWGWWWGKDHGTIGENLLAGSGSICDIDIPRHTLDIWKLIVRWTLVVHHGISVLFAARPFGGFSRLVMAQMANITLYTSRAGSFLMQKPVSELSSSFFRNSIGKEQEPGIRFTNNAFTRGELKKKKRKSWSRTKKENSYRIASHMLSHVTQGFPFRQQNKFLFVFFSYHK